MIVIAPYDPAWPETFAAEAERIHRAFGQRARRTEHVPGLVTAGANRSNDDVHDFEAQ